MNALPSARGRRIGRWAFGFGLATLVAAFFVPPMSDDATASDFFSANVPVFVLGGITGVLVVVAHVRNEDRRLYFAALALSAAGVFLDSLVLAVVVTLVIWVILSLFAG